MRKLKPWKLHIAGTIIHAGVFGSEVSVLSNLVDLWELINYAK